MIASDDIIGYAEIWESRRERVWSEEEIQLCQTLANQAALVIENARLYNQMHYLAVTDTLSGVLNRRGLFDRGEHEVNRAQRFSTPLAAIMLDIDHFKHINDTYSHAVGDEVLRTLARVCQANLRSVDLIGRYGGEEFAILLPDTDTDAARRVAERLRQAVAETPVIIPKGMVSFTVSLGVASLVDGNTTLAVLLDQADSAMYFAKRSGRNQVALVDSDVTQTAWLNL
jgi:diguanylate cyclase (GGDEF)-like protein